MNNNQSGELYKSVEEWYLAWETYKYINRNPQLRNINLYKQIEIFTEDIIIRHRIWRNGGRYNYEDMQKFYRYFVTLENKSEKQDFIITNEVIEHYKNLMGI